MGNGIRAEIRVQASETCPIARISNDTGASSFSISTSIDPATPDRVTEEFMLDGEAVFDGSGFDQEDMAEVFSYGNKNVYRFSRERGRGCPCELVEQFDCPIIDVHTRNGSLYLVFHARDMDELQDVIEELRSRYPDMEVQRLLRSQEDQAEHNLVFVDRGDLTDRQREVIEMAHEMGYFRHPKGANAGEVAAALGISTSTFTEHLAAAQSKLLGAILEA